MLIAVEVEGIDNPRLVLVTFYNRTRLQGENVNPLSLLSVCSYIYLIIRGTDLIKRVMCFPYGTYSPFSGGKVVGL